MENSAHAPNRSAAAISEQNSLDSSNQAYVTASRSANTTFTNPSRIHVIRVILKLLPIVVNFRRDRREWVKREGRNINENKYRKHAQKALQAFTELGPSYIKLGQWLSTRADILPQPYLEVLASLQDDVQPAPFSEVKPIIESEVGKIDDAFEDFNPNSFS